MEDVLVVALAVWAIAWSFFAIVLIIRKNKANDLGPLVYDFEDSSAGRVAWMLFNRLTQEERHRQFPATLRKGGGLALMPGLKAYLLKDAALINSPDGEFIQGTVESTSDEVPEIKPV